MIWNEKIRRIFGVAFVFLVFMGAVLFLFTYGWNFYNKVRCRSRNTIEKMMEYCESRNLELRDMRFEEGLCISVCGR
jgi:hypothetical protein